MGRVPAAPVRLRRIAVLPPFRLERTPERNLRRQQRAEAREHDVNRIVLTDPSVWPSVRGRTVQRCNQVARDTCSAYVEQNISRRRDGMVLSMDLAERM
jgi:hypothetical protein